MCQSSVDVARGVNGDRILENPFKVHFLIFTLHLTGGEMCMGNIEKYIIHDIYTRFSVFT